MALRRVHAVWLNAKFGYYECRIADCGFIGSLKEAIAHAAANQFVVTYAEVDQIGAFSRISGRI